MKKKLCVFLAMLMAVGSLAGCGKFTCDLCGEEKSGKKYVVKYEGEKATLCKDCKELYDSLMKLSQLISD